VRHVGTRSKAACLAVLVLAACGGAETPSSATVSGSIDGRSFHARSALSVVLFSSNDDGNSAEVLLVEVGDLADDCSNASYSAALHPNAQSLGFALSSLNASGNAIPPAAGVYQVVDGSGTVANTAQVSYQATDASCALLPLASEPVGMSGSVELSTVTAAGVRGSFDVVLAASDAPSMSTHLHGSFDTVNCVALGKQSSGTGGACM
jgi:hypothetical protein